ncbi:hypothetical protein COD11_24265 [Bacillus sp. AFS040349]|nr:hypothetical protein [Planctomycetaceae bacterium]PGT78078.1 hypothetical protein COD11_24265 [Bacillus sp. AFS040349]
MGKIKIDGFRMHQHILDEFRYIKDQSFDKPTASAYVVYLTMLKQMHIENNPRGILKEYNLSYWARKLDIPYTSLYGGKKFLEKFHFVKEEIQNDLPVLVLKDVERLNTPEREGVKLNYLLVPHALFDTNILAEFVRTSNPEGIELLLSLFNQFRTSMSNIGMISLDKLKQSRKMSTLKKKLNKKAKDVRKVLEILEALFDIEFEGLSYRKEQVWIKKINFSLKPECVIEDTDEFEVNRLLAKFSQELTYRLDELQIKYKARDKKDIMIAFKQEVVSFLYHLIDEDDNSYKYRDKWLRSFFLNTLDSVVEHIQREKERLGHFKIYTIGGFFRKVFRKQFKNAIKDIPYEYIHDAKIREFQLTGSKPLLSTII